MKVVYETMIFELENLTSKLLGLGRNALFDVVMVRTKAGAHNNRTDERGLFDCDVRFVEWEYKNGKVEVVLSGSQSVVKE